MAGANAIKTSDATIQWGNVAGGIFTADTNLLIFASAVADTITIGGPSCAGVTIMGQITGNLTGNVTGAASAVSFNNGLTTTSDVQFGTVTGAVWNDIADFLEIEQGVEIEFGKAYVYANGKHRISENYCECGVLGIASDTFGFGVGKKADRVNQLPLAIAGVVLAYVDKEYESGTPLTCTSEGRLTKMGFWSRVFYPERMVATFYKSELKGTWNGIVTKGRDWVKIV